MGINVLRITLKIDQRKNKSDSVCDSVKKCLKCERIITGKYVNDHKCGRKNAQIVESTLIKTINTICKKYK